MSHSFRKLASSSFLRVINTAAGALVSLLIMPFVIHKLGDRLCGVWTLVATFVGYYGLLELGHSPAIARYLGRSVGEGNQAESNRIFNTVLRIYAALGVVVLAVRGARADMEWWAWP